MKGFKTFNKEELFNNLDNLSIERVGEQIVTKYHNVIKHIENVSKIYEVFDFGSYVKEKIELITSNFEIHEYRFILKKGIQEVTLLSDCVDINGLKYYKSFHILSSSDRSRKLNLNMGLYAEDGNYTILSAKAFSVCKRHITGLNKITDSLDFLNAESFNEQIESIGRLIGHNVYLSKIRSILVEDESVNINHKRFDALKQSLINSNRSKITNEQYRLLARDSKSLKDIPKNEDILLDAYMVFNSYLRIFMNEDSHTVKRESERIFKITQHSIRIEKLKQLDF